MQSCIHIELVREERALHVCVSMVGVQVSQHHSQGLVEKTNVAQILLIIMEFYIVVC
jgi:hypothetical protein